MNREPTLNEQRLQYQLEVQSQQIERVFDQHRLSARVAGGMVQSQVINFDLQSQVSAGLERLRGLKGDMMTALGVTDVSVVREDGKLQLRIGRPYEPPVALLPLLNACSDLSPATIPIGLAEDGRPVLVRFSADAAANVLIVGAPLAGKTTLLRTMAAALALCNRQSELQLIILDPCKEAKVYTGSGREALRGNSHGPHNGLLEPLNYLPHLVTDMVSGLAESASVLQFLADELIYRQGQDLSLPHIVVLIDHAVTLLERGGSSVGDIVLQLLQHGADVGIHLVVATRRPGAAELDAALKAQFPLRLVGRVETTAEAYQASGVRGSQADGLMGLGDFLAVLGDERTHFQAAYIGDYDLHMSLSKLYSAQRQRLLAQPFEPRLQLPQDPKHEDQSFSVKGGRVAIEEKQSPPLAEDDQDLIFGLD